MRVEKSRFAKALFLLKLLEIRLRFVALLVLTALVVGCWDTITNYVERWTRAAPTAAELSGHAHGDSEFFCPMHPFVVRETPGQCPICGMELVTRKRGTPAKLPDGVLARVQVSPERIMQAGVQVEVVAERGLTHEVTAFGNVEVAETHLARVSARFPGRVEELLVNTGAVVLKGQALARLYSPKYLAASFEYIQALADAKRLAGDAQANADAQRSATELAAMARKPLERQGFTAEQLDELAKTGKTPDRIVFYSPVTGTVLEKNAVVGDTVEENSTLYTIADLSTVWIDAQAAESDLAQLKAGMAVEVNSAARPGQPFSGTVDMIYPTVNPENRAVKIRIVVENKNGELKPGMYVTAMLRSAEERGLALPETAVIDTGSRQVVFVESTPGVFDMRVVRLGARAGIYYPVLGGIAAGERIVSKGSFLIDAEARLNGGGN